MKILTCFICICMKWSVISEHPLLLLSFDGFRHDYLERINSSHIQLLIENGVKAPLVFNTFATKTLVNHFTIATGVSAKFHGVVNNVVYDKILGRDLKPSEESFWTWGITEKKQPIVPIWKANEKIPGRYSGSSMWAGSDYAGKPTYNIPFNQSVPWIRRIEDALQWLKHKDKPASFISLYFEEPDLTAHLYGPESEEVTRMIELVDNTTGYIVQRLKEMKLWTEANVILTSDHGFSTVSPSRMINISRIVDPTLYSFHGDTPVMHVLPKEGKEDYVYAAFQNASLFQNFTVYRKAELPKEWRYGNVDRTLPIVLVADEGYVFDDFEEAMERMEKNNNRTRSPSNEYGMHGYDSRLSSMHPFFVAHGPDFKVNFVGDPFYNVDIYPLMCNLLGIRQVPANEGKFDRVEQYLKDPYGIQQYGLIIMLAVASLVITVFLISVGVLSWMSCNSKMRTTEMCIDVPSKSPKKASPAEAKDRPEIQSLL